MNLIRATFLMTGGTIFIIMNIFAILLAVPFAFFVSLGTYVMYSYALSRMADNTGIKCSILAWIPFARLFTLGQLADRYNNSLIIRSYYRFILPLTKVVEKVFQICLFIGTIFMGYGMKGHIMFWIICVTAAFMLRVLEFICYYKIFSDFEPNYVIPYMILCLFGLEWIAIFLCRNNVPVGIAGHCRPKQPRYNVNRY